MFHTKHSKPVRSYHYLSPRWFTGRIKITLRFSILFALFHVKLPSSDPCSVALLIFHMKLYQASTSLATFHIAGSHEVLMITLRFTFLLALFMLSNLIRIITHLHSCCFTLNFTTPVRAPLPFTSLVHMNYS